MRTCQAGLLHQNLWLFQQIRLMLWIQVIMLIWDSAELFPGLDVFWHDPEPFDMDRDLLTPTFKKKRPQLLKYYQVHPVLPPKTSTYRY